MRRNKSEPNLHRRLSLELLVLAMIAILFYFLFILAIVDKLEATMISTLVSHETEELVSELARNPDTELPETGPIKAFLDSREDKRPVPHYFADLEVGVHTEIKHNDRILSTAILDLHNDRMYISFDVTDFYKYEWLLIFFLIISGAMAVVFLLLATMWLSKKYLMPVSRLAEEVAKIDPVERHVRIEPKYVDYEVGLIARAFDKFMDRLDEFVHREQSFSAAVSHELRTPVAVISTSLDLLKLKGIQPNQVGVINRIRVSTNYMQQVIDSLLFFSRHLHESVDQSLPLIELSRVCENIYEQYKPLAEGRSLRLKYRKRNSVYGRVLENHLEIVLGNLVRNAINNTDEGSVEINLGFDSISIKDSGYGLEPSQIKAIRQQKIMPVEGDSGGLGLYLITSICRYYNLRLEVESSQGQGSCFTIAFPHDQQRYLHTDEVA